MPKKALIITYYWPPAGGSGVQRWLKFVKYFRNYNIEPVVYTVENPNYPINDNSLESDIPENLEVLKQPILEPNNIMSLFGKKRVESAGFLNPNPSLFGKLLQFIRANCFIPDARKFWVKPSVKYLKKYLKSNKIDVIITTGPPHSIHLIGLKLKQLTGVKWIADFRDPWTKIDYFHQLPLTKFALKKHYFLEKNVLKNADSVVVVGKTMKDDFLKFNKNITVITNGFDNEISNENSKLDKKFTLTHVGLINADRNAAILWEVLEELIQENNQFKNDFQLKLIGKVDTSVLDSILNHQLRNFVEVTDYKPHSEVLKFQNQSQVLLLLVNNVPSAKGIITGKIFEYLTAKRPIVAIAPENGDLAEIISKTNSGVVVDFKNKELLKKTILNLYTDFKENKLVVNSKNINQYHRKFLTEQISEVVNSCVE